MFCKHTNYEQVTRSPLILVAPDIIPAGTSTNAPTEFVDIYPILCGLTNLEPHLQQEGTSLLPIIEKPTSSVTLVSMSQYPRRYNKQDVMSYACRDHRYRYRDLGKVKKQALQLFKSVMILTKILSNEPTQLMIYLTQISWHDQQMQPILFEKGIKLAVYYNTIAKMYLTGFIKRENKKLQEDKT